MARRQGGRTRERSSNPPVDPRLVRYASASRGFFVVTALIVTAQTATTFAFIWLLGRALVGAIEGQPVETLLPFLVGGLVAAVCRGVLVVWMERTSAAGSAKASLQLRARLVDALATLGPGWMSTRNAASFAVTAGRGLEALDAYFGRYLPQLVACVITLPLLLVTMFLLDPPSALIVLVALPLIPIAMIVIGLLTQARQRRQFDTLQHLASRFADTVDGLGTLKIFGRDRAAADEIGGVTRRYARETMSVLRVSFLSGFALELLASLTIAVVAVAVGTRLLNGEVSLFVAFVVLLLVPETLGPLRQVGVQFHAAAEGVAATTGIFDTIGEAALAQSSGPALTEAAGSVRAAPGVVRLEARDLRIARGPWDIGPVDLSVASGEVVLLEGASGAGKSSVIAALLGFAPHSGSVSPGARAQIAWMGQRPGLLSGSIGANIALGQEDPDEDLIRRCLADAHVPGLPLDLDLGTLGTGLSGGQAQRVALARALYRLRTGASVLVLDEPTSALDRTTEAAVWATVRRAADDGAGVLLVSHRRSARDIADRIIALPAPARREVRG